jgi:hypothetical protein
VVRLVRPGQIVGGARPGTAASEARRSERTFSDTVGIRCASAGVFTIRRSTPARAASSALRSVSSSASARVAGKTPVYVQSTKCRSACSGR